MQIMGKNKLSITNLSFKFWIIFACLSLILLVLLFSKMGYINTSFIDTLKIITKIDKSLEETTAWFVIHEVRLPRILIAILTGIALSLSGLVFQGVLLNPLADPYTLGISSGASFGAALGILLGLSGLLIQTSAFLFALLTLFIVLKIANFSGKIVPISLILSGVIIGAFFSAGLSFTKYLAGDEVASIFFWLLGSFQAKTWNEVLVLFFITSIGAIIIYYYSEEINILSLGEKNATSMGVDTFKIRTILLITASLISSITVSICGIIGFIGLIIPHLMRFLVGPNNKKLIIVCSLWGGVLVLVADNLSRVILPHEVPIGIITALLGAPFFTIIFRNKMKGDFNEK